jgi:hypothetical protein
MGSDMGGNGMNGIALNGANGSNGSNGTANTGGGGGGRGYDTTGNWQGSNHWAGGSGIVIIRYPDSSPDPSSYTGTKYTSGGYKYYKFNATGSITF